MLNTDDKKTTDNKSAKLRTTGVDASKIQDGMKVVCSEDGQFAVVDHMEGASTVKLRRDDQGVHHYMPLSWVTLVDDKVHVDRSGDQAMREWSTKPPKG